jgi:hypothetical protein
MGTSQGSDEEADVFQPGQRVAVDDAPAAPPVAGDAKQPAPAPVPPSLAG